MPQSIDHIEQDETTNWEFDQSICNDLRRFLNTDSAEVVPAEALRKSRILQNMSPRLMPTPPRSQR